MKLHIIAALGAALLFSSVSARAENSVLVYDESTQEAVVTKNADQQRPIASITKVMTAIVTLSYDSDLTRKITVAKGSRLPAGLNTRQNVLTAMLVSSDNVAAAAFAKDYPGGFDAFIAAMNQKAKSLGMTNTAFADSSGLNRNNVSTARDLAIMMRHAAEFDSIRNISTQTEVAIADQRARAIKTKHRGKTKIKRTYKINLGNTNRPLLFTFDEIIVSKTGFTNPAGFCVAMVLEKQQRRFVTIVLGMQNKQERFKTASTVVKEHIREIELDTAIKHKQRLNPPKIQPEPPEILHQII
jgi:D-alanyl-D-alanine endopeptidase (penicillin-binding protein 7)